MQKGAAANYGDRAMWSIALVEPVKLENGEVLRTLEDVHYFLASLPTKLARHDKWQTLDVVVHNAAMTGSPLLVEEASEQLKRAMETPPYTPMRLMAERRAPHLRRDGVGRPRPPLLGAPYVRRSGLGRSRNRGLGDL
jgi:NAD(P)-dependent dehydrogenase (short-subunit alcohol dehydrogenase family)